MRGRPQALWGGLLAASLAGSSGCAHQNGTDAVAPAASDVHIGSASSGTPGTGGLTGRSRLHFTFHVGDRWDYRVRVTIRTEDGGGPASSTSVESRAMSLVMSTEQQGARTYWVLQNIENVNSGSSFGGTYHLRPDTRGLFHREPLELGPRLSAAAADAAPGSQIAPGADPGEQTLLSFPLFVGAGWRIGGGLSGKRTVSGIERLHLPAGEFVAWRIDHTSASIHAPDRLTLWYAEAGLVRLRQRQVQVLFGDQGFRSGQRVTDVEYELLAFTPGAAE